MHPILALVSCLLRANWSKFDINPTEIELHLYEVSGQHLLSSNVTVGWDQIITGKNSSIPLPIMMDNPVQIKEAATESQVRLIGLGRTNNTPIVFAIEAPSEKVVVLKSEAENQYFILKFGVLRVECVSGNVRRTDLSGFGPFSKWDRVNYKLSNCSRELIIMNGYALFEAREEDYACWKVVHDGRELQIMNCSDADAILRTFHVDKETGKLRTNIVSVRTVLSITGCTADPSWIPNKFLRLIQRTTRTTISVTKATKSSSQLPPATTLRVEKGSGWTKWAFFAILGSLGLVFFVVFALVIWLYKYKKTKNPKATIDVQVSPKPTGTPELKPNTQEARNEPAISADLARAPTPKIQAERGIERVRHRSPNKSVHLRNVRKTYEEMPDLMGPQHLDVNKIRFRGPMRIPQIITPIAADEDDSNVPDLKPDEHFQIDENLNEAIEIGSEVEVVVDDHGNVVRPPRRPIDREGSNLRVIRE